jgi:hypothetical protein
MTFTKMGTVQTWMREYAASAPTDACTDWPFATTAKGYPMAQNLRLNKQEGAYRIVWEMFFAQPFPEGMHARHLCNNGHLGCVNPLHVQPGTPADNAQDRIDNGTTTTGSKCAQARLSDAEVISISHRIAEGEGKSALAREHGVSPAAITFAWQGATWKHLDPALFPASSPRRQQEAA